MIGKSAINPSLQNNDNNPETNLIKLHKIPESNEKSLKKPFFLWAKPLLYVPSMRKSTIPAEQSPYENPQIRHRRLSMRYPLKSFTRRCSATSQKTGGEFTKYSDFVEELRQKFRESGRPGSILGGKNPRKLITQKTVYDYIYGEPNKNPKKRNSMPARKVANRSVMQQNESFMEAAIEKSTAKTEEKREVEIKKEFPMNSLTKRFMILTKIHALNPFNEEKAEE